MSSASDQSGLAVNPLLGVHESGAPVQPIRFPKNQRMSLSQTEGQADCRPSAATTAGPDGHTTYRDSYCRGRCVRVCRRRREGKRRSLRTFAPRHASGDVTTTPLPRAGFFKQLVLFTRYRKTSGCRPTQIVVYPSSPVGVEVFIHCDVFYASGTLPFPLTRLVRSLNTGTPLYCCSRTF